MESITESENILRYEEDSSVESFSDSESVDGLLVDEVESDFQEENSDV